MLKMCDLARHKVGDGRFSFNEIIIGKETEKEL